MSNPMTFTASGDALIVRRMPADYPGFQAVARFIQSGDARMTNLETTLTRGQCYPSAFSGGTWLTSEPAVLCDLLAYGFNLVGWANNHTLDYGPQGLLETKRNLDAAGVAHAGAGKNLYEASRPAMLDTPKGRVAFLSICSTFDPSARAGEQSRAQPGRPGLNPLRHRTVHTVRPAHMRALREIAEGTLINAYDEAMVRQGFRLAQPEGLYAFGGLLFEEGDVEGKRTLPHAGDVARTESSIRDALADADYAVVMVHSHEVRGASDEESDDFVESFAHSCIDAGACAVVGSGTHQLKGIELYRGRPIFYSLGNFTFQNQSVRLLPPDFMEQYGLPASASSAEGLAARAACASGSLQKNVWAYRTALPRFTFEDGRLTRLNLMPISLGEDAPRPFRAWPRPASSEQAEDILRYLQRVSARYGTQLCLKDGYIEAVIG